MLFNRKKNLLMETKNMTFIKIVLLKSRNTIHLQFIILFHLSILIKC